jgi:Phytanoyl-CoA dioxygenase (PhyH)
MAVSTATRPLADLDLAAVGHAVQTEGIAGLPRAFDPAWGAALREDFEAAFADALSIEDGTVGRGPERHYFAVPPERLRGFLDLVTHPWVTGLCERMLGPDWTLVEVGFDVPLPGAVDQPWHRDFPTPPETRDGGPLSSLAFNVTTVTVRPEMGPFEIVPGSHRDDGELFEHGMFPLPEQAARYTERARRKMPQLGDMSVRTGLAIHRGTRNLSAESRPVLVLGMVAPFVSTEDAHDLILTRRFFRDLPASVRGHLRCTQLVDSLAPMVQRHDIEGLKMGG